MKDKEQSSALEKIRTNIQSLLSNVKEEEQIDFLTQRLLNVETDKNRVVDDLGKLRKENAKIPLVFFYNFYKFCLNAIFFFIVNKK